MYVHIPSLELFRTFALSQQFVLFMLFVWETQRLAKKEQYLIYAFYWCHNSPLARSQTLVLVHIGSCSGRVRSARDTGELTIIPYFIDQTPRPLLISACDSVRRIFKSGVYTRAASISYASSRARPTISSLHKTIVFVSLLELETKLYIARLHSALIRYSLVRVRLYYSRAATIRKRHLIDKIRYCRIDHPGVRYYTDP